MIKLFEFFAGIGAYQKALINNRQDYEIAGTSEWFIDAILGYNALYNNHLSNYENDETYLSKFNFSNNSKDLYDTKKLKADKALKLINANINNKNYGDITKISGDNLKDLGINVLTYSFPCQDISTQGKQAGLFKDSNTRSSLLWEIYRILTELKQVDKLPKILIMENVKNLYSKKHINTFNEFKTLLNELGYQNSPNYVFNSSNFGSAQNRERAFLISVLAKEKINWKKEEEIIKLKSHKENFLKDILRNEADDVYFDDNFKLDKITWRITKNNTKKNEIANYTNFNSERIIYDENFKGPTLTASGANNRLKIYTKENRIKIINAKEALKYMGFSENDYLKLKNAGISDNKIRFLAGNSIVVNVLENLFIYVEQLLNDY